MPGASSRARRPGRPLRLHEGFVGGNPWRIGTLRTSIRTFLYDGWIADSSRALAPAHAPGAIRSRLLREVGHQRCCTVDCSSLPVLIVSHMLSFYRSPYPFFVQGFLQRILPAMIAIALPLYTQPLWHPRHILSRSSSSPNPNPSPIITHLQFQTGLSPQAFSPPTPAPRAFTLLQPPASWQPPQKPQQQH